MYTIKEIAQKLGLSEHTVRFYSDKGLIPGVRRNRQNHRVFDEESVNWLTGIQYLKAGGMSLKAIQEYITLCQEGDSTLPIRYHIILKQREIAREQLETARNRLAYLEQKAETYRQIAEEQRPDSTNPATWPTQTPK